MIANLFISAGRRCQASHRNLNRGHVASRRIYDVKGDEVSGSIPRNSGSSLKVDDAKCGSRGVEDLVSDLRRQLRVNSCLKVDNEVVQRSILIC